MDLEKITEVTAVSSGVVEHGSVTIYTDDNELQFDIEELCINGNHEFRVYQAFGTNLKGLDIEVDEKSKRILDEGLVNFIYEQYQKLSSL